MTQWERSGWRDARLSERHRKWGVDCPATDIDFLLAEYDHCRPKAIIEYKHEYADDDWENSANTKALCNLGNMARLPVFAVRYGNDLDWYNVIPLNGRAKNKYERMNRLTEREYVAFLYELRGRRLPSDLQLPE